MPRSIHLLGSSCFLLSSSIFPAVAAYILAEAVPQYLDPRQEFLGGWAMGLPGTTCPTDVPVQCTGSISNPACCPTGTFCDGLGEEYCCPTDVDCKATVTNFPKCAVATHTLYLLNKSTNTYFCCPPGQFGVLPLTLYGGFCQPDGTVIAASRIASKVTDGVPQTGVPNTSSVGTGASGSTTSSSKTTTTSRATSTQTNISQSTSRTSVSTSTSTSTSGGSVNNTNNQAASSGSSLGPGVIAGIVIGALGVLALFVLAFVIYRRRRPSHGEYGGQTPAPAYAYQVPPQQDMSHYPPPPNHQDAGSYPTAFKGPDSSHGGVSTVTGSSPGLGTVSPRSDGYGGYNPPPPPAAGYSEIQGQNTWDGRAEMGATK